MPHQGNSIHEGARGLAKGRDTVAVGKIKVSQLPIVSNVVLLVGSMYYFFRTIESSDGVSGFGLTKLCSIYNNENTQKRARVGLIEPIR